MAARDGRSLLPLYDNAASREGVAAGGASDHDCVIDFDGLRRAKVAS